MIKPMITGHMLIKNEEQFVWFAIQSVLDYVDRLIIFDTGSTDKTVEIIKTIQSNKIIFVEKGNQKREELVKLRNEMVEATKTDWFMLIDGDEVWPKNNLQKIVGAMKKASSQTKGIVVRTRNCVGDIWHYQPESAGKYELLGMKGHLTIRGYRKKKGYSWKGIYPNEAYCNSNDQPIHLNNDNLKFIDVHYWHLTHLKRSTISANVIDRKKKFKREIGIKAKKSEIPETLFLPHSDIVPSPFQKPIFQDHLASLVLTPIRNIKRRMEK